MASVRSTSLSSDAGEKSLEYEVALRAPAKTRSPSVFEAASFRLSIFPKRSTVENSSVSRSMTSAEDAPARVARSTKSAAIC